MTEINSDLEIDGRSLDLARLTTSAQSGLRGLNAGDVLKVITNPGLITNARSFCRDVGGSLLSQNDSASQSVFYIKKL